MACFINLPTPISRDGNGFMHDLLSAFERSIHNWRNFFTFFLASAIIPKFALRERARELSRWKRWLISLFFYLILISTLLSLPSLKFGITLRWHSQTHASALYKEITIMILMLYIKWALGTWIYTISRSKVTLQPINISWVERELSCAVSRERNYIGKMLTYWEKYSW